MKHVLSFMMCGFISLSLCSGTMTVTGSATVSKAPEFVTVTLHVKSQCYKTPEEASQRNKEAAANVQSILNQFINTESDVDGVFSNGSYASAFYDTIYDDNGHAVTVCKGTYQESTRIKYKTENIKDFSDNFAQIQTQVMNQFVSSGNGSSSAVTFVTVDTPSADVCSETKKEMVKIAKRYAIDDAKENARLYTDRCGVEGPIEIVSIGKPGGYDANGSVEYAMAPMPRGGSAVVTINFEDISVTEEVSMELEFPYTTLKCSW